MLSAKVFLLKCACQTYAWGKYGDSSEVACLLHSNDDRFTPDKSTTYAELWMGTHPKGPSVIVQSGELLSHWIENHPESLGSKCPRVSSAGQLPFLFKVLSVNVALSIQVHPDKVMAEKLHQLNPDVYVDDNHKPELAIALTPFEALCGFRPKDEIVQFLNDITELRYIVGDALTLALTNSTNEESTCKSVRDCFTVLMTCAGNVVEHQLRLLVNRLQSTSAASGNSSSTDLSDILLRLHSQFPGDVGCFCIYFLNFVRLQPGQAIFLNANLPHAYLAGDCLECMACSDNVVRAGLTPKFKDVATLCDILDYRCQSAADNLFTSLSDPTDNYLQLFDPPVPEFTVARIEIPVAVKEYSLVPVDGASILIVLAGRAVVQNQSLGDGTIELKRGSILFISASESLTLTVVSVDTGVLMFRAFCTQQI